MGENIVVQNYVSVPDQDFPKILDYYSDLFQRSLKWHVGNELVYDVLTLWIQSRKMTPEEAWSKLREITLEAIADGLGV